MNSTMKLLLLSDIFVLTGFGLIQTIFAIYINEGGVAGGSMLTAGLASALFLLPSHWFNCPLDTMWTVRAARPDDSSWELDFMTAVSIIYVIANSIYLIYLAGVIDVYGPGSGLAYPTWLGLWSANLDKGKESFQWSIYSRLRPFSIGLGRAMPLPD